ncbi:MAG: TIGR00269 family protein [Nanoarchaeota archaeon]|nr:MAG: TIGR00269 family protein [Nanoarchaeota archaeon]
MNCSVCNATAIINSADAFCKEHFFEYFENTVKDTIDDFSLISKDDKIAVACSGGKDSTILLHLLKKWGYNIEALAIDEGIARYRDAALEDLKTICKTEGVLLRIVSYQENFGTTLDSYLKNNRGARACTVCGVWRRHLLNRESKNYDAIATGHNLDDEAQSILMNLIKSNIQVLARLGPKTEVVSSPGFTPRVKPLYFVTEKETSAYALLKGFSIKFAECPNAFDSFRAEVRDILNEFEAENKGSKRKLMQWFIEVIPKLKAYYSNEQIGVCARCGEPSRRNPCISCGLTSRVVVKVN